MIRFVIIALLVILLDQGSKFFAWRYLPSMQWQPLFPYGGRELFRDFFGIDAAIVNHANTGAAWGLFADHQEFLMGVRVTLVVVLMFWLFFLNKKNEYILPYGLIISGAVSNIVDYFFYGHVVDIFYFRLWGYSYPVFNIADSAICIGVIILLITLWRSKK